MKTSTVIAKRIADEMPNDAGSALMLLGELKGRILSLERELRNLQISNKDRKLKLNKRLKTEINLVLNNFMRQMEKSMYDKFVARLKADGLVAVDIMHDLFPQAIRNGNKLTVDNEVG